MNTPLAFTCAPLGWRAWLDTVPLETATPEQLAVLETSHPQARSSDYYRLLVHEPTILDERSGAFNAIMYAPGGLSRAERELASTVVSRLNGCVYCASVHAQRFTQLARREDVIAQVFADPASAGTTPRERAIVRFAIALTEAPEAVDAEAIAALRAEGLDATEILDLGHAIAIFAWANRLMLSLGEPVVPQAAG
ncbi:peroxidase-related enzyme [Burkholderia gladioli]|uniref:peroxidase-related enzyme n=1 Tax=Burkholderia gladioli TaxID=28095 RepID=UPI00163E804B|nr:peroxidase-related enzyme [Burkholderia gladioli]